MSDTKGTVAFDYALDVPCERCGAANDRVANPNGRAAPRRGDVNVCIGCGLVSEFTARLTLRRMTIEQYHRLPRPLRDELTRFEAARLVALKKLF
jgi:hypothetical protein